MKRFVVFLGPTLQRQEATEVLDAIYLPPAGQGAVIEAVQRHAPAAILLIDGTFQTEPAVRHKEILWAIGEGIPVFGAASMGALRAAELFPYMQGCGLIYRWYRRTPFAPDDAVAVLHGPAEVGHAPLTDALVDVRLTLKAALRGGRLSRAAHDRLVETAVRLNFRERTLDAVVAQGLPDLTPALRVEIAAKLRRHFVQRKKLDALAALGMLRDGAFDPAPPVPELPMTAAFSLDLYHARIEL